MKTAISDYRHRLWRSPLRALDARLAALTLAAVGLALAGCGQGSSDGGAGSANANGLSQLPPGIAGKPAPRIRGADARGGTIDTAALRGRPYAVTFLYANCPDVCPLIASELQEALGRLGARALGVAIVAVSVDPRGDTREAVRVFLNRHREPPNFHYVIGSDSELKSIWKAYYAAPQIPGDPRSSHTAAIWLVDRRGRLAGKFSAGTSVDPSDVAGALRRLLSGA